MISLLEVQEVTEEQLGRKLHEKEIDFLEWVYERYTEDKQKSLNV